MAKLSELKALQAEANKTHGHRYFTFIAPFDFKHWDSVRVAHYVQNGQQVPDQLLSGRWKLDLYFMDWKWQKGMKWNPTFVHRYSLGGLPES